MILQEYDKSDVIAELKEKAEEMKRECLLKGVAMFYSIAVKNDNEGTVYTNGMVSARDVGAALKDDHLIEHANVFNGFKTQVNTVGFIDDSFAAEMDPEE